MDDFLRYPWQETPKSTHNGIEDDKIMQYLCVGMLCYGMDRVWLPKTSIRINSEKQDWWFFNHTWQKSNRAGTSPNQLGPWPPGPLGLWAREIP